MKDAAKVGAWDYLGTAARSHVHGRHRAAVAEALARAAGRDRPVEPWAFLVTVMSTETCRKIVMAAHPRDFCERQRTPYGTILVVSNGTLEGIFGRCVRDLRHRLHTE